MITVTVSGKAFTGKSSVAYVVANALLSMGFSVDVKFLDGQTMHDVSKNVEEKLINVKQNQSIKIVEVQEHRRSIEDKERILYLVK